VLWVGGRGGKGGEEFGFCMLGWRVGVNLGAGERSGNDLCTNIYDIMHSWISQFPKI